MQVTDEGYNVELNCTTATPSKGLSTDRNNVEGGDACVAKWMKRGVPRQPSMPSRPSPLP